MSAEAELARQAAAPTLLDVRDLHVEYSRGRNQPPLRAVGGVSFQIAPGETVGLVGESGSGKTTIGRAILGLAPIGGGRVTFDGAEITHAGAAQRRALSSELQVVFQDPYSSLNPARTIGRTLRETLHAQKVDGKTATARMQEMLGRVGLPPDAASRYPAHFSGGQRQRIAIARALMARPRLVVCDEPVSALDVSVQASVLNLLRELQRDPRLSYLFIAHDLPVVRYLSHRIVVLYRGRVMEEGAAPSVYQSPAHPYTQTLLEAAPVPDVRLQRARREGRDARRADVSKGVGSTEESCPFAPRCPHATEVCWMSRPRLEPGRNGTLVACHRWREIPEVHPAASGKSPAAPPR